MKTLEKKELKHLFEVLKFTVHELPLGFYGEMAMGQLLNNALS